MNLDYDISKTIQSCPLVMQTKNYLAVHYIIRARAVVATPIKKQQVPFLTFQESTLGTLAQFFHLQKHTITPLRRTEGKTVQLS